MRTRLNLGPFRLDRSAAVLLRDGRPVEVGQKAIALLRALSDASGEALTKAELMDRVWPDVAVEEGNLTVQVAALRKAMGPRPDGKDWIETVPRVGYRLAVPVAGPPNAASMLPSVAVLPFQNLSGDPDQEYFTNGMVEDLITALSRFKSFAVVARNSVFVYKGRAVDVREAAKSLGVGYVLEGSVRRKGKNVRVGAQLIDGLTGAHLWAENFDGMFEDVFDFQDRIVANVIGLIEPQIRMAEIRRARRKRPESVDAYDLYLQTLPIMQGMHTKLPDDYSHVLSLLDRAITLDPGFAPALASAAWAHEHRLTRGWPAPPGVDDAREAIVLAERAVAADGNDAIVVAIAGVVLLTIKNDEAAGLAFIKRARALNSNSYLVANMAGYAYFHVGCFEESIACHQRALDLSPNLPDALWSTNGIAAAHLAAGRFEESLTWGRRALEATTSHIFSHAIVIASYVHLHRLGEAQAALQRAVAIWPTLSIATLLGRNGRPESRDRLLVEGLLKAGLSQG